MNDHNCSNLLFFTAATKHCLPFIPLYVYFAHHFHPGASFEFTVSNSKAIEVEYANALAHLRDDLDVTVVFQDAETKRENLKLHNTLRFITTPQLRSEYVYIGDVDVMILENLFDRHRPVFEAGLPYSNIIREGIQKLSGLHFTRYETFYPLPEVDDILADYHNDEEVLYQIVKRKGHLDAQGAIDTCGVGRPVCGIHMSLNRIPFSDRQIRPNWGITWAYARTVRELLTAPETAVFVSCLPQACRLYLANLYFIAFGMQTLGREMFQALVRPDDIAPSVPSTLFKP